MEEQLVRIINKDDLEELKKIIENGFDINKKFSYLRNGLFEDILNDVELDSIDRHVNFHNYKGNSLLHYACIVSRIEVVNDKKKYKPPLEIIKYLIDNGADINQLNLFGESPLHFACKMCFYLSNDKYINNGNDVVLKLLIENGADVNIKDSSHSSPLKILIKNCENIVSRYINFNFTENVIKYLIQSGAEVKKYVKSNENFLLLLYLKLMRIYQKYTDKCGYDIDIKHDYNELIVEAVKDCEDLPFPNLDKVIELIEYLIGCGPIINCTDYLGNTILHYAVQFGTIRHVKTLVEKGADFNITNAYGKTPLDNAIKNGNRLYILKYFTQIAVKVNHLTTKKFYDLQRVIEWINYIDYSELHSDLKKKNRVKYEIADILIRKGFNASKYPNSMKMGKLREQYERYKKERETVKEVINEKKLPAELENLILDYLGVETIYNVKFKFPIKDPFSMKNNSKNAVHPSEVRKLYDPEYQEKY